jgi:uncharacterized protein YfaS (alpha-2-macroglobulin family)
LAEKELTLGGQTDAQRLDWIDLEKILPPGRHGVYELDLVPSGSPSHDRRRLLFTDLNVIAKREGRGDKVWVWAIDMTTLAPVGGVSVRQLVKSGRAVSSCTTDRGGTCALAPPALHGPADAAPFAIVAQKGDDSTYLRYSDLKTDDSEQDVSGDPYRDERPYRAAIYSDRGVYRPGETVHVSAILRDQTPAAPKAGIPVEARLIDPRKKVARRLSVRGGPTGMVSYDFKLEDYADTGRWRVVIAVGGKPVGEYGFAVEEFVPERMKVEAVPHEPAYLTTGSPQVDVQARYLFGGSAAGNEFELLCELSPTTFRPAKHGEFEYGVVRDDPRAGKPLAVDTARGELDAKGRGQARCELGEKVSFAGAATLTARVAVMEAGSGRTTVGEARVPVHPARFYVGLRSRTTRGEAGKPIPVEGIVVDWKGEIVDSVREIELELLHTDIEYDWYYDDDSDGTRSRRFERLVPDGRQKLAVVGGRFSATLTPEGDAAGYVFRVRAGRAQTDLRIEGDGERYYWFGESGEGRDDGTPHPLRATTLEILPLAADVRVGAPTKVSFRSPFKGRALLTAETDGIVAAELRDVAAGANEWSFQLPSFVPNVYVSVLAIKDPHLDSKQAFLPERAFGVRSLRVDPEGFTEHIELGLPKEIRSSSELEVQLDLGVLAEPTTVTVAAVDQGTLQLTRFAPPDPLAAIFARRALGVATFETVGWNVSLPAASRSPGGDGDGEASEKGERKGKGGPGGRVPPVKPVALFAGPIEVPKSGQVTVRLRVPEYRGALTVMAVSAGAKRLGHASGEVVVRDPLVVETTLPRFLAKGDVAEVPVFVSNQSGRDRTVEVRIAARPRPEAGLAETEVPAGETVTVVGPTTQSLTLKNGASDHVVFSLQARAAVGAADVKVEARAGELASKEELAIPLVPALPRSRTLAQVELPPGRTDVRPYLKGWLPTTEQSTLWVTAQRYAGSFGHLSYLVHYPYGCIEQTTSSTRPLLFVSDLIGNVDPTLVARGRLTDMVMSGIDRVFSMQAPSGGFAYWPGGGEPTDWGTAYATHMLLDAKRLQYSVPEDRLHDALDFIEKQLTNHETSDPQRAWNSDFTHAEPYLHYVLALAGRGRKARIERLVDAYGRIQGDEAAEDVYLLKAALYLAGDRRYEADLKHPDTSPIARARWNSWSYYTDLRRRGLELSTFTDLFGDDPAGEPLARLVAEDLQQHKSYWYTTQELVWGVTGLGKRSRSGAKMFAPPRLYANGRRVAAKVNESPSSERSWALARASEYEALAVELPKKDAGKVYLVVASEGVRERPDFEIGGAGLAIERTYRTRSGQGVRLDGGGIGLGDVVFCEVKIRNTSDGGIQNIALVDRFPAGMEIENPHLGRSQATDSTSKSDELWTVDHINVRDDRLEAFGALARGQERKLVYALRAVVSGRFALPPVSAEAMYDPAIWARGAGGKALIKGPWQLAKR